MTAAMSLDRCTSPRRPVCAAPEQCPPIFLLWAFVIVSLLHIAKLAALNTGPACG